MRRERVKGEGAAGAGPGAGLSGAGDGGRRVSRAGGPGTGETPARATRASAGPPIATLSLSEADRCGREDPGDCEVRAEVSADLAGVALYYLSENKTDLWSGARRSARLSPWAHAGRQRGAGQGSGVRIWRKVRATWLPFVTIAHAGCCRTTTMPDRQQHLPGEKPILRV